MVIPSQFSPSQSVNNKNEYPSPCQFRKFNAPLVPSSKYWNKLHSAVTKFICHGKRPRLKLSLLQRAKAHGGLSLPNFKLYYWAFTLRPLLKWFDPAANVSWRELEESMVHAFELRNVNVELVSQLVTVWRAAEKLRKISSKWNLFSPVFNNPGLLLGGQPIKFPGWSSRGIHTLGDLFDENCLRTFQDVCDNFNLPGTSFFFYLQLRSSMKAWGPLADSSCYAPFT